MPSDRSPYFRLYVDDWLSGTLGLSYEEKGFYIDALCHLWSGKRALPSDDAGLARVLRCNPRTARKLRDALLAKGKIAKDADGLTNSRMMREIEHYVNTVKAAIQREESKRMKVNSSRIRPEFELNSSRIRPELEPNSSRTGGENSAKSMPEGAGDASVPLDYPYSRCQKIDTNYHPEDARERATPGGSASPDAPVPDPPGIPSEGQPHTPVVPSPRRPRSGREFWARAMAPEAHEDCYWTEDGRIAAVNGFRAELEAENPGIDLAAILAMVAGEVTPSTTGVALKNKIRRRAAYLQHDEARRDRRYRERVASEAAKPKPRRC